jgi:hypothetical protein
MVTNDAAQAGDITAFAIHAMEHAVAVRTDRSEVVGGTLHLALEAA